MSHNALGSSGLELLLQSLLCENLTHLEISSVEGRPRNQHPLQKPVASYLAQVRGWECGERDGCLVAECWRLNAAPVVLL